MPYPVSVRPEEQWPAIIRLLFSGVSPCLISHISIEQSVSADLGVDILES